MKIGSHVIDPKTIYGVILGVAGWIVANVPALIPTLPDQYQRYAGNAVTIAGFILAIAAQKPLKQAQTPPVATTTPTSGGN